MKVLSAVAGAAAALAVAPAASAAANGRIVLEFTAGADPTTHSAPLAAR